MTDRIYYAPLNFSNTPSGDDDIININAGAGVNTTFYGLYLEFDTNLQDVARAHQIQFKRGTIAPVGGTTVPIARANLDDATAASTVIIAATVESANLLLMQQHISFIGPYTLIPTPEARWKLSGDEYLNVNFETLTPAVDFNYRGWICFGES